MTDLATVKRLSEHTAESVTSIEQDIELLIASGRKLAKAQDALSDKVSDFMFEYRRASREITDTLTLNNATLDRILEKLRTA